MITYQPKELRMEDWATKQQEGMKPAGLWYSPVEDGVPAWRAWCQGECWSPGTYTHQYRLDKLPYCSLTQAVAGDGQGGVLLLSSEEEVLGLSWKFLGRNEYSLRWDKLAALVCGVEISPYQYGLRFGGPAWYYGWDMASGCIWRRPQGMVIEEQPLDWDGSVQSWEDWEDWDDSEED
jgi:hypothetical protein